MSAADDAIVLVHSAGWLTTVQDAGRWGWQHLGVPVGGPMDANALRRANRLLGNHREATVLEMTLSGPTLEFRTSVTIALTGAAFDARLDGQPLVRDVAVTVSAGAILEMGARQSGARAYLGVAGGFDTPVVLGSRATTVSVLGGRPLAAGDQLALASSNRVTPGSSTTKPPPQETPGAGPGHRRDDPGQGWERLRVLPGPDADGPGAVASLDTLCADDYVIGAQSNRMGYRLQGPPVAVDGPPVHSTGTVMGMVQIPPDGQPLLLMADRQTTGGYPVVAVVISADLPLAGQLAPGDRCRFGVCSRGEAMAALIAQEQAESGV